jgi:hypothetical protein
MKRLMIALLALFIYGCEGQSDVPIRSAKGDDFDVRLAGVWVSNENHTHTYVHIGKVNDKAHVIIVEHHEDNNSLNMESYPMVSACLSNGCYLSANINKADEPSYFLMRYSFSQSGTLTVQYINNYFLKNAVKSGKITGKVNAFVNLHATEPELREFVEKYANQLFTGEKFTLSKLK